MFGSCSICFRKFLLKFLKSAEHSIKASIQKKTKPKQKTVCHDHNCNENLIILISFLTRELVEATLGPCPGCYKAEDGSNSGLHERHCITPPPAPPEMTPGLLLAHILPHRREHHFILLNSATIKPFLLNISGGQLTSENV